MDRRAVNHFLTERENPERPCGSSNLPVPLTRYVLERFFENGGDLLGIQKLLIYNRHTNIYVLRRA